MSATQKIRREEVTELNAYDREREQRLQEVIALKNLRRVALGDRVSLAFENRATVLFQIQEMLRAERILEEPRILEELEVYSELLPGGGELSATLFIEITAPDRVEQDLNSLLGIEECLWMEISEGLRLQAWFEPGHSRDDRISAVHYVRFRLSEAQRDAFRAGEPVVLTLDHPRYHARTPLTQAQQAELTQDL